MSSGGGGAESAYGGGGDVALDLRFRSYRERSLGKAVVVLHFVGIQEDPRLDGVGAAMMTVRGGWRVCGRYSATAGDNTWHQQNLMLQTAQTQGPDRSFLQET